MNLNGTILRLGQSLGPVLMSLTAMSSISSAYFAAAALAATMFLLALVLIPVWFLWNQIGCRLGSLGGTCRPESTGIMIAMVGARYANGLLFEVLLLVSWPVVALFVAGTAFVVLLLLYFIKENRYRRPPVPEKGVEYVVARRAVEARLSALAPKAMLLADKERSVTECLQEGDLSEEARRTAEGLLREAAGFWKRFVEVSDLAGSDPARAAGELHHLSFTAETVLEKLTRAEVIGCGGENADERRNER